MPLVLALSSLGLALWKAGWKRLLLAFLQVRRDLRAQRGLALLDGAALRDLGLDRSEYGSYLAEAAGEAEITRLRTAPTSAQDRP